MLKDSDIARYTARRTHRTYTPAFKAELVAACLEPGTSIAALANSHGMNANVLHRWLKEHARTGWLAARRLHQGRFHWPSPGGTAQQSLQREQLDALVLGLPWQRLGEAGVITLI